MAKKELLTGEQRENILELNQLSEFEFASYYSLSDDDIDVINHHRRDSNRLGFAIQLCLVRYPGCTLSNIKKVPHG
jgi:TnpA family transposase